MEILRNVCKEESRKKNWNVIPGVSSGSGNISKVLNTFQNEEKEKMVLTKVC